MRSCYSQNTAALFKWFYALFIILTVGEKGNKNLQEKLDKGIIKHSWATFKCTTEFVQWGVGLYGYALIPTFKSLLFKFL